MRQRVGRVGKGESVAMGETENQLSELETALGYTFKDRVLLETALTNPSYRAEREPQVVADNQRLEFLGDAVVGLLSAQELFARFSDEDEGRLTVRRSHLASRRALAGLARRVALGKYLRIGKTDEMTGGRDKDKVLANALEAVLGAAWCDGGLEAAKMIYGVLASGVVEPLLDMWADNPKGRLQELAQRHVWPDSPAYETVHTEGPSHAPVYTVKVRVAGGHEAVAEGGTKRAAEVAAAEALLRLLEKLGLTR